MLVAAFVLCLVAMLVVSAITTRDLWRRHDWVPPPWEEQLSASSFEGWMRFLFRVQQTLMVILVVLLYLIAR